jgi:hypothetical protein
MYIHIYIDILTYVIVSLMSLSIPLIYYLVKVIKMGVAFRESLGFVK